MASALLCAAAFAAILAAFYALSLKVDRPAATEGLLPSSKFDYKTIGETPLESIMRDAMPHEDKSARFQHWTRGASMYEPFLQMPFTPVLSCEPGISVLMDRFDWRLVPESAWEAVQVEKGKSSAGVMTCASLENRPWRDNSHVKDPRTVWAAPHAIGKLLALAERDFDASHARRVVMFSGTEMPLSRAFGRSNEERLATLARLRRYFGSIAYMTKDIRLPGVRVAPMGLGWGYTITFMDAWIRGAGGKGTKVAERLRSFEANLSQGLEAKSKNMLATRGVWASWLDKEWTAMRAEQLRLQGLLYPPTNTSTEAIILAVKSRGSLRRWAATAKAQAMGVELRKMPLEEWWVELPKYRFLLAPLGSAIQTAKSIEALLVLTIPVIEKVVFPTFTDLMDLGFPFVLVDSWENITAHKSEQWWAEISPRLESFRRNCLTVNGYWKMITGAVARCA